jgi:arginase family enzyme
MRENQMIKIFGTAFDPLDIPERVDIKVAYLNWLRTQGMYEDNPSDPYDFLGNIFKNKYPKVKTIEWIGKFPVESWLRPKPSISETINIVPEKFTEFLNNNGCYDYYNRLVDYLKINVGSSIPVMIGVDHCLTGGVLKFLKEKYDDFNILILDSHCDIIDLETRRSYFGPYLKYSEDLFLGEEIYECGSFLAHLLSERTIKPENLWIMGTQDLDQFKANSESLYSKKVLPWIEQGMHVVSKENLIRFGIPEEVEGPTYVSFDMDLGSLSSVFAARFLNYIGLNIEQFLGLVNELSEKIRKKDIDFIGLDIMEVDIHFLGENIEDKKDYTAELGNEILEKLVYANYEQ